MANTNLPAAPSPGSCGARYTMTLELSPQQTGFSPIRQFQAGPTFICELLAGHEGAHLGDDGSTVWVDPR